MVNTEEMSYEQLLELEDRMGYVSRGYTEAQIGSIAEAAVSLSNKSLLPEQYIFGVWIW